MLNQFVHPLRLRHTAGEPGRKVTWLELFFDLAFVAAVAQVGSPLAEDYSVAGCSAMGSSSCSSGGRGTDTQRLPRGSTPTISIQRVLTLVQIFVVAVMAVNAKDALDSRSSAGFAAAYAVHAVPTRGSVRARAQHPRVATADDGVRRGLRARGDLLAGVGRRAGTGAVLALGHRARDRCRHTARHDTPGRARSAASCAPAGTLRALHDHPAR